MLKEYIENAVFECKFLVQLNQRFLAEVPQQKCFKENILTLPNVLACLAYVEVRTFPGKQRILGSKLGETVLFGKCCFLFSPFLPSFLSPFFFQFFSLSFIVLFLLTPTSSPLQDSALNVGYTTHILTFNRQ